MTGKDREVKPPSATLLALEGRGLFDMASLAAAAPFLTLASRGTRHAVIVLPGLGADDHSTVAIRSFLSSLGYDVHRWSLGRNIRPSDADVVAQISRLRAATDLPVSLVGWSRGGIMAREAARQVPAAVRLGITSGVHLPHHAPAMSAASGVCSREARMPPRHRSASSCSQGRSPFRRPPSTPDRMVWLPGRPASKRQDKAREYRGADNPHRPWISSARTLCHCRPVS